MTAETLTAPEPSFRVRIMTTSQAADLYLGELARQGRTQRTIQSYRRTLHKLADSYPHPSGYRCALCGQMIDAEAVPIAGVYGKGYRHADNAICMENLREADPYGD
jgi:hypothetical protein